MGAGDDFLKKAKNYGFGSLALTAALDIASSEDSSRVMRDYLKDIEPLLLIAQQLKSPLGIADENADGDLRLAVSENGFPVGLNLNEVHTIIAGSSNTGKTVCADILNRAAIEKECRIWLFVKTDDSTRIIRRHNDVYYCDFHEGLKLNPLFFLPRGILISIFRYSFVVFEGSEAYLMESISELKAKNTDAGLQDLYYFIRAKKHPGQNRIEGHRESVLSRLGEILDSPLKDMYDCARGHENDIVQTSAIFNVSELTLSLQRFFVCSMLMLLYLHNREDRCI